MTKSSWIIAKQKDKTTPRMLYLYVIFFLGGGGVNKISLRLVENRRLYLTRLDWPSTYIGVL